MWIASKHGFFSIVQHRDDPRRFIVRARARNDLVRLLRVAAVQQTILETGTDYPYRVHCSANDTEKIFSALRDSIDYPNFKSEVARSDHERADLYLDVWMKLKEIGE